MRDERPDSVADRVDSGLRQVSLARIKEFGVVPKRDLGQNFLIDDNILAVILAQLGARPDDVILEVGAGLGVLTAALAGVARCVHAFEVDHRLKAPLEATLGGDSRVVVHFQDVLKADLEGLDPGPTLCASNLPYSVAGPFIAEALQRLPSVRRYVVMVQREVAERMAAVPGTKDFGTLSVWVQLYTRVVRTRPLARSIFYPQPHVDSSLVVLERLSEDVVPGVRPARLRAVIQAGFGQRRKTLANGLSSGLGVSRDRVVEALADLGLAANIRAERLQPHQFVQLAERLTDPGNPDHLGYDACMEAVKKTPAKVNLCLLVGPTSEEGFHELFTVFAAVDLFDTLDVRLVARPAEGVPGDLKVKCPAADGEANLAFKAIKVLEQETGWAFDGRIEIDKRIPVGGGLGGGSSDGACALLAGAEALAEAGGPVLDAETQVALARSVGADVAFFLRARPAIGRGIGEILEPIDLPELALVLVMSNRHLSTERVYRAFDEAQPFGNRAVFDYRSSEAAKRWHQVQDAAGVARMLENDLEESAYRIMPTLMTDRELVTREGALGALVSGSGPTIYGVCASAEKAEELADRMVIRGFKARAVKTVDGVG